MANICTNILWISGIKDEKQMDEFTGKMAETFECFYEDEGETFCEIGFNSRNIFPEKEMKGIISGLNNPDIQAGIISYDFSNNYVAYHLYKDGKWNNRIKQQKI